MNNFIKGMLVGVGVGLLVAPMRGEEMRKVLNQRVSELRGYLPENEQMNMYTQQISDRVSQTAGTLKDYAQQAATSVKSATGNVSNLAQKSVSEVQQTGSDVTDATKRAAKPSSSTTPISNL